MALTMRVGLRGRDSIVVIETSSRYIEKLGADGRRWSAPASLHHHLAHHLAGRGAHSAAVLGDVVVRLFREFAITLGGHKS